MPIKISKRLAGNVSATDNGINGHELRATDAEVVTLFLALADNRVSEGALANWIRAHSSKHR